MSDHLPSDDPSSWPRDPFKLLGVARGASAREVKRAYHDLIRKYKPEHAPEAFRRIREAYESARQFVAHTSLAPESFVFRIENHDEGLADSIPPEPVIKPESPIRPRPLNRDPWKTACKGNEALAFEKLLEQLEHDRPSEEVFLQLYWLSVAVPSLCREQAPAVDWLIRGLRTLGPSAARIRQLLEREAEIDQTGVVCERLAVLLSPDVATELHLHAANWRWRAARSLMRWNMIMTDVDALRASHTPMQPEQWLQILLAAAGNGVWAILESMRKKADSYRLEAERLALAYSIDVTEELDRLDHAECIMAGLRKLYLRNPLGEHLYSLFRESWDDRGARLWLRVLPLARALARDPRLALRYLDNLVKVAPAAFGLLMELMEDRSDPIPDSTMASEVEAFLETSRWSDYPAFRLELLRFCLIQAISPEIFARSIPQDHGYLVQEPLGRQILNTDVMEFIRRIKGKKGARPLNEMVRSDRTLAIIYHAGQLARE